MARPRRFVAVGDTLIGRVVNALGVGSIVALCNATRDVQLPYVFGGDGATFAVPGSLRERVIPAFLDRRRSPTLGLLV